MHQLGLSVEEIEVLRHGLRVALVENCFPDHEVPIAYELLKRLVEFPYPDDPQERP